MDAREGDRRELADLVGSLVAIDSTNPDLGPGAGEGALAGFVAGWLREAGLAPHVEEAAPGRPNVVARIGGHGGGRSLMLNAHLDTVGVAGYPDPFTPRVDGGRLHGRGALDTKAGLAAAMRVAAAAAGMGLAGDVLFAAVADEEAGSIGTEALLAAGHRSDAAIVIEPTGLEVVVAHRGFVWGTVTVRGVAAHGSRADLGVDAIVHAAPVLAGVAELASRLADRLAAPDIGGPAVHASRIRGGQEMSSYPAECVIELERRLVPGETVAGWEAELAELAGRVEPPASATSQAGFHRSPLRLDASEPIVQALLSAAGGGEPAGAPWWTDAALLTDAGVPAVIFGPVGEGMHAHDEWVDLDSAATCERVLLDAVRSWCGQL